MKTQTSILLLCFFFLTTLPAQTRLQVGGDSELSGDLQVGQTVLFGDNMSGEGTRLLWLHDKGALRAGTIGDTAVAVNFWDAANVGINSFVSGKNSLASGERSFIGGGSLNRALGLDAGVLGGAQNYATANRSFVAGGSGNRAEGANASLVGGSGNRASGANAFIGGGTGLLAPSYGEVVFGRYNESYIPDGPSSFDPDDRLFVIGNGTSISNRANVVTVLKNGNVGIGTSKPADLLEVQANGTDSRVRVSTTSNNDAVFRARTLRSDFGWYADGQDYSFKLYDYRSNADVISVDSGGTVGIMDKLGIGTFDPSTVLDIIGEPKFGPIVKILPTVNNWNLATGDGDFRIGNDTYHLEMSISLDGAGAGNARIQNDGGTGRLILGSRDTDVLSIRPGRVDITGDIYQNNSLIHSDQRFKTAVRPISQALSKIRGLRGVSYAFDQRKFPDRAFPAGRQFGLIAQEVEKDLPELVRTSEDGYKAVNYDGIAPLLIEGVKEQQMLMDELRALTQKQQEQLAQQQQQIEDLKHLVHKLIEKQAVGKDDRQQEVILRSKARLDQNLPNPFSGQTLIKYYIPEHVQNAQVRIITADGRPIESITIAERGNGQLKVQIQEFPAGTYYYTLVLDGEVWASRPMVLTH